MGSLLFGLKFHLYEMPDFCGHVVDVGVVLPAVVFPLF